VRLPRRDPPGEAAAPAARPPGSPRGAPRRGAPTLRRSDPRPRGGRGVAARAGRAAVGHPPRHCAPRADEVAPHPRRRRLELLDPVLRARLGSAGRELVERCYPPAREIDGYLEIYRGLAPVSA